MGAGFASRSNADIGPTNDIGQRPAWVAFQYSVGDSTARAAVWRKLKKLRALSVQQSGWAVPCDEHRQPVLDEIALEVEQSGGSSSVHMVTASSDDLQLNSRLDRACEHLWDDFFNRADSYRAEAASERSGFDERLEALAGLYASFGSIVGTDIVRSGGLHRAEALLHTERDALVTTTGVDPEGHCNAAPVVRHDLDVESWPLVDGQFAFCARLRPSIDPLWEIAFQAFEARNVRPSAHVVSVRSGTWRWISDDDRAAEILAGAGRRIEWFESSLR